MYKYFYLLLLIFIFSKSHAQIINLGKCDADKLSSDGLQQLKKTIGDARIVVIGEQSHWVGTDYESFAILSKFLHEEMGFNVILQEYCFDHFGQVNKKLQKGGSAQEYRKGMYWPQAKAVEQNALLDYIDEQAKTSSPIYMEGVDPRIFQRKSFYTYSDSLLSADYNIIDNSNKVQYLKTLHNLLGFEYRDSVTTPQEKNMFYDQTVSLIKKMKEQSYSARTVRLFKNLLVFAKNAWNIYGRAMNHPDRFIERERMMGENIIWLAEKIYTKEKIIVHLHNGHAAKNYHKLKGCIPDSLMKNETNAGSIVYDYFGEASKFIASTYYAGTYCKWDYKSKDIPTPHPKSIEDALHKKGLQFAYKNIKNKEPFYMYFNDFNSWLPGNYIKAPFGELFDGIIFIDKVKMPKDKTKLHE